MKVDDVKALSDNELEQVMAWAQEEKKFRTEKRKQEAIAAIREIAAREHIPVRIDGQRGRPAKGNGNPRLGNDNHPAEKVVKNGKPN